MNTTMSAIADLTVDLLDMAFYGSGDPRTNMTYFTTSPASNDGSKSVIWSPWRRLGIEPWDQPSDLYIQFDISGTDPSLWKALKVVYNLQLYSSVQAFYQTWKSGLITKTPPPTTNTEFLLKNKTGQTRELEDRLAPTILSPEGNRFKIDRNNRYVEYLGWTFYTRFDYEVGIQFYDIKFKGERIMYELSLQGKVPSAPLSSQEMY
jgi:primary-amine oxidase